MPVRSIRGRFIDGFIPSRLLSDREMRTRARMFLFSHLFGPFLGNVIPAYLLVIDPSSHGTLIVLTAAITSFWLYPIALRLSGAYKLLSYLSIQNLLFAILWGCFFYGGVSSPFLPWLVTVPLLAFFYLGASPRTIFAILSQVAINGVVFVIAFRAFGETEPRIPIAGLQVIGAISTMSAAIYVSMMAIYYSRVLDSQSELEGEVAQHLATAAELKAAAAEADRASAAKADFLANMSHELRTPLNAVIGYSQILLEETDADIEPQIVTDLDRIHSAGNRLLSIVNSILDLSKIEAGMMTVDISLVEIQPLLFGLIERHSYSASLRGNRLDMRIERSVDTVVSDELKLSRILDTLISNALDFTKDGLVSIEAVGITVADQHIVRFVVADTGCGISEQLVPIIFNDFTKRNDEYATAFAGAGLGLPIAHRLCRLIGARISLESVVGKGTRVMVDVPRAEKRNATLPCVPAERSVPLPVMAA